MRIHTTVYVFNKLCEYNYAKSAKNYEISNFYGPFSAPTRLGVFKIEDTELKNNTLN